jgi:hypothetical protein
MTFVVDRVEMAAGIEEDWVLWCLDREEIQGQPGVIIRFSKNLFRFIHKFRSAIQNDGVRKQYEFSTFSAHCLHLECLNRLLEKVSVADTKNTEIELVSPKIRAEFLMYSVLNSDDDILKISFYFSLLRFFDNYLLRLPQFNSRDLFYWMRYHHEMNYSWMAKLLSQYIHREEFHDSLRLGETLAKSVNTLIFDSAQKR